MRRRLASAWRAFKRALRAARHLVTSPRLPRWLRWLLAVGCLPLPGPLDEVVLAVALLVIVIFYRAELRAAWAIPAPLATPVCPMEEAS